MTRRERLERKLERRRDWAESRKAKAESRFNAARQAVEAIPFGQPILVGHHSEKHHRAALARHDSNMDKAFESYDMAEHHESKANGLERQLDTSIFSDDSDAIEQLQERVARRTAERERMKKVNAAHKQYLKRPESLDKSDLDDEAKALIRAYRPAYSWEPHPYPPYAMQNLGATIRKDMERIKDIQTRIARAEKAEQNGGVVVEPSGEYCRVTFAEKPGRDVLDALKESGFHWGAGSWCGRLDKLPAVIGA